ncbi:MAG: hypothetical protein ABFS32_06130 [Bacteroidota bacterium]
MSENSLYLIVISIFLLVLGPDLFKLMTLVKRPKINFNKYFLRINLIVLLAGIILTLTLTVFEVNYFNYSKPVEHAEYKQISLEDFNGLKLPNQMLQGEKEFAFITTNISFQKSTDYVDIKALFHPARSYVYINDLQNDDLLTHELYHFHITEVWARNFRKELKELDSAPNKRSLLKTYNKIINQENLMQKEYDYDTDHGYLLGNQIHWQNKIDSLLLYLDGYKNTEINF